MANDNKEIGDIVKKCKVLLLDIEGTTTSISFVKDKLFPYAEENIKQFLNDQWEKESVQEAVTGLRKLALEDQENSVDGVIVIPGQDASKEDQIEGLVNNVKWQMSSDRKTTALKLLQGLIWKQGYDKGDIKGHVYEDVSPALEQWRSIEGQKVYIYSSGSVQAQKLLFGQSMAGNLLCFIDGHFDTAIGTKQDASSYTAIIEKIGCKADEILFLTDIVKEAEAAHSVGLHVALVSREGNSPLPGDATAAFPVIHSFAELTVSNKRKTKPQGEQPAKIQKTDTEDEEKTNPVSEDTQSSTTVTEEKNTEKTIQESEKMDVDDQIFSTKEETEKNKTEEMSIRVETVVEEITDTDETVDANVCDIKPIIIEEKSEENLEKTEEKETEKMETDLIENEESVTQPNEKANIKDDEAKASIAEETPPIIVTEIEEITTEKIGEVTEIIEDIVPVVEEPAVGGDIEDLQNVGEVLEKECDEILSKVQDVTNLDNIPLKPLLNPIAEETMETENVDPNDIVDRILDTELELEMKQCEDIDLNTVAEITEETKTNSMEESNVKEKTSVTDSSIKETNNQDDTEKTTTENNTEAANVTEEKNSSVETKVEKEDKKVEEVQMSEIESKASSTVQSSETIDKEELVKTKDIESVVDDKIESKVNELQVNGKTTNGDSEVVNLNGDASKEEELSSRLSENGDSKEVVNGSNEDSTETEQGQGDSKIEAEVPDVKLKSVATDEPRTDPIEQPTEA